ncbi:MAG: hypothetical protein ABI024_01670 [Vicinamibacterales bacterium]
MAVPGLQRLDGKLLDGLVFCSTVYDIFDEIQGTPAGLEELRLLTSKRAKRLMEELLPLARYVQSRYAPGSRLRIRWVGGNQPYDAFVMGSGLEFERRPLPRREYVEVTTAAHKNDYLVREQLHTQGLTWGGRTAARNRTTREVESEPFVYDQDERLAEHVDIVGMAIEDKAAKPYPKPVTLLVRCIFSLPVLEDEWAHIVKTLRQRERKHAFREIVLLDEVGKRCTTLSVKRFTRRR